MQYQLVADSCAPIIGGGARAQGSVYSLVIGPRRPPASQLRETHSGVHASMQCGPRISPLVC